MPNRPERDQRGVHQEWEPGEAFTRVLEGTPLLALRSQKEDLARLKAHLEEALEALETLERQRGLPDREKMRVGALRMLLRSIEEVKQ